MQELVTGHQRIQKTKSFFREIELKRFDWVIGRLQAFLLAHGSVTGFSLAELLYPELPPACGLVDLVESID